MPSQAAVCDVYQQSNGVLFLDHSALCGQGVDITRKKICCPAVNDRPTGEVLANILDTELVKNNLMAFCATNDNAVIMKNTLLKSPNRVSFDIG